MTEKEKQEMVEFLTEFQEAIKEALKQDYEERLAYNKKALESLTVKFN